MPPARAPITYEQLIELLKLGLSSRQIAQTLGTSQTNVRYWCKKFGLKLEGKPGSRPREDRCAYCGATDPTRFADPQQQLCLRRVKRAPRRAQPADPARRTCTRCGVERSIEEFIYRSKAKGIRETRCSSCTRALAREYYHQHRGAMRARAARRNQAAREAVAAQVYAYLQGKQCVDCGERDLVVLDFDHVRGNKRDTVGGLLSRWRPRWSQILEEIAKCEIRCVNCHRRKTAHERGYTRGMLQAQPPDPAPQAAGLRHDYQAGPAARCSRCGLEKDLTEFCFKNKQAGKRRSICRVCSRAASREHYQRNRAKYIAKARRRNQQLRGTLRSRTVNHLNKLALVLQYLQTRPCVDCGERDPLLLEFDHVRGRKEQDISRMITDARTRWPAVLRELGKCEVRCGNCHRRRTARERGWARALLEAGARAGACPQRNGRPVALPPVFVRSWPAGGRLTPR
jgi:hypothetical protein